PKIAWTYYHDLSSFHFTFNSLSGNGFKILLRWNTHRKFSRLLHDASCNRMLRMLLERGSETDDFLFVHLRIRRDYFRHFELTMCERSCLVEYESINPSRIFKRSSVANEQSVLRGDGCGLRNN